MGGGGDDDFQPDQIPQSFVTSVPGPVSAEMRICGVASEVEWEVWVLARVQPRGLIGRLVRWQRQVSALDVTSQLFAALIGQWEMWHLDIFCPWITLTSCCFHFIMMQWHSIDLLFHYYIIITVVYGHLLALGFCVSLAKSHHGMTL